MPSFEKAHLLAEEVDVAGTSGDNALIAVACRVSLRRRGGVNFLRPTIDGDWETYDFPCRGDLIDGHTGDDRIVAGTGRDEVFGGGGADRVAGGRGNYSLDGRGGNDRLFGGSGRDHADGAPARTSSWVDASGIERTAGTAATGAGPSRDALHTGCWATFRHP